MLILISMLCYVMLYYSKVLKFFVVVGGGDLKSRLGHQQSLGRPCSQEGNTGKIYISILSLAFTSLGNYTVYKIRHQGAAINMWGIETAFKCTIVFTFTLRFTIAQTLFILWSGSTYHTFHKKDMCVSVYSS